MAHKDTGFAYLDKIEERTGYTNNFLESRHQDKFFTQSYSDYKWVEENAQQENTMYRDILKTTVERTPISDFFFGSRNINHLQGLLIKLVKDKSNGLYHISRQNDNELLIIMRSIYLQYAKHLPFEIQSLETQVCELNRQVIIYAFPKIMSSIQQYLSYIRDHGSNTRPIDHGEFISSAGTRVNRGFDSLFI